MTALAFHESLCLLLILGALRFAVAVDDWRRSVRCQSNRLLGSLKRLRRRFLERHRFVEPAPAFRRRAWNRTPPHVERAVLRLHVEQPQLGNGQLRHLLYRVAGHALCRETLRRIILRSGAEIAALEKERKQAARRRVVVKRPGRLWGADLALVWVLGFFPVWVFVVVDYCGSRVVALEPVARPNSAEVVRVLSAAFEQHGAPARILTDRGSVFRSELTEEFLGAAGVRHVLTRAAHPWTNGRAERLFRTFKETLRRHYWLVSSRRHLARICDDFRLWHNRDRPHQGNDGLTPDEVWLGRSVPGRATGRISYFDGRLLWWRLG